MSLTIFPADSTVKPPMDGHLLTFIILHLKYFITLPFTSLIGFKVPLIDKFAFDPEGAASHIFKNACGRSNCVTAHLEVRLTI